MLRAASRSVAAGSASPKITQVYLEYDQFSNSADYCRTGVGVITAPVEQGLQASTGVHIGAA